MTSDLATAIYIFLFGMCIGSFMNVCIFRLPMSKSIADPPRSVCPSCGSMIRYYDNIPVFSYLWLKGRCRHCRAPISFRYPLVETLAGGVALSVFLVFGLTFEGLIYFIFIAALLVITFIDIDHKIIPNVITIPGIPLGLVAALALPGVTFIDSVLGLLAGGGSLLIVGWAYHLLTRKEGMGGGDIKLLAMIGTIVAWKGVLFTIFVSSAVGTLVGLAVMLVKGKNMKFAIPFGPFLSIGAITYIFFGQKIICWYFNMLR
ncbi:MAG: prepilin peptidase [Desulfobacterales bacterium]|uniref:Prepilin leader peptidase/N-methyltransferase n=1 Tax=Candidatus Desulfatibia profunda TaxID=2841695 RepID=A0A8J6NXH6_9BACT|nr:prepilin peptidase [Candidatus Desulfatibia profunda]MBL7180645.1 prepilin peptidase [Desulfobacterales bacterium]